MSYEIIEKNEYGVLVKTDPQLYDCEVCKYGEESPCRVIGLLGCDLGQHYILDKETVKLEPDSQKELLDLQLENDQLKERIKELESEKICSCGTPSVIHKCKNCNGIIKYSK